MPRLHSAYLALLICWQLATSHWHHWASEVNCSLINGQARGFLQRLTETDAGLAQQKCQHSLSVPATSAVRQFIQIQCVWTHCAKGCSGILNTKDVQCVCTCGSDTCQKPKPSAGWEDIPLHNCFEIALVSMKHRLIGLEISPALGCIKTCVTEI